MEPPNKSLMDVCAVGGAISGAAGHPKASMPGAKEACPAAAPTMGGNPDWTHGVNL